MEELWNVLLPILATGLTALGGYLTVKIKDYIEHLQKEKIAYEIVLFVDQKFYDEDSEDKFDIAKEKMEQWLTAKKISYNDIEIEILIESAVNECLSKKEEV